MSKQKTLKNYNDFDIKESNTTTNKKINNNLNKNIPQRKDKKKSKNNKRKLKTHKGYSKYKDKKRNKSEEKNLNIDIFEKYGLKEESEDENEREIIFTEFTYDRTSIKKCFNKIDEFPSFSVLSKKKEVFLEKNIKNFINDSSMLNKYKCLKVKNEKYKENKFDSFINPKESFEENKERLKLGINKYLLKFENFILSKYCFSFDNSNIKKLEPFVDNPNDINLNYFSKNNQIFLAYEKKNIKSLTLSTQEDIQNPIKEIKIDNEEDIYGSITKINQRWLKKQKLTFKINKPNTDTHKISYCLKKSFEIPLIEKVFQEFVKQKIKTMKIDKDNIQRLNYNLIPIEFLTEINYTFKEDNLKIKKINLENDIFIQDSIKEINQMYKEKYLFNMELKDKYLHKPNNNIFSLDDMNINSCYEKFKKWKNDRINKKNKYICSGNASIELMKNTLINKKYDNPNTSILHNLSLQLNEINDKNNNENDKLRLAMYKSANNNYSKCVKKLKEEVDLSLSNKNSFNNKLGNFNKIKSENLRMKKKLSSINSQKDENDEKNNEYKNMMKKMKKTEEQMNKKRRKIIVDKIKQQQDNELEQEIKKEKKYNMIYPILFLIIPFIYSVYSHYWRSN